MPYIKIFFVAFLLYSSFALYTVEMKWLFIQYVNLIFHEAGHILFIYFGNFLSILGGSLLEIIVPTVVTIHFLLYRRIFAAGFSMWWLSTALYSVSVYAADARTRDLPLITGDSSTHDWFNLLGNLNLLQYDQLIGNFLMAFSVFALLGACYFFYVDLEPEIFRKKPNVPA